MCECSEANQEVARHPARRVCGHRRPGKASSVNIARKAVLPLVAACSLAFAGSALAAFPTVITGPAQSLTYSGATLTGGVNPKGGETVYDFQYGPTKSYGSTTVATPVGNGTAVVPASAVISGLTPATTYHFRLVATGASGTTDGADHSFTTPAIPLSLALTATPNPVTFGGTFLVEGTLSGTGSANHAIVLQANPFPYTAGFTTIGNPELTSATGSFQFTFAGLVQTAQLRVITMDATPTSSPVVIQQVAVQVVLHAAHTKRKHWVKLYGSVTPAEPNAQVSFERFITGKGFVNVTGTIVKTAATSPGYSTFSRVVHLTKTGAYRALVVLGPGAPQTSANSGSILIH